MIGPDPAARRRWALLALAALLALVAGTVALPGAAAGASADASTPSITTPAAGSTSPDTQPHISGKGEPGNTAIVTDKGGVLVCAAVVAADGAWECVPPAPLARGQHTISVVQLDKASSLSASSAPVAFTVGNASRSGTPNGSGTPAGNASAASSAASSSSVPSSSASGTGQATSPGAAPDGLSGPSDPVLADVAPKAKSGAMTPLAIAAIIALALTFATLAFVQMRPRHR